MENQNASKNPVEALVAGRNNQIEAFNCFIDALQPVIEAARAIAEQFFKIVLALKIAAVFREAILASLTPPQVETAYRRYAERLNARRTRKISWRRLNHPQRERARALYLVECWQT